MFLDNLISYVMELNGSEFKIMVGCKGHNIASFRPIKNSCVSGSMQEKTRVDGRFYSFFFFFYFFFTLAFGTA